MKPNRFLTLCALLLASALPARAADKLEQWYALMPKETVLVVAVKNTPELLADWDKAAFSKFMQDEAVQRWMAPMRQAGDMPWDKFFKENNGAGMYDTLKEYPGAVVNFLVLGSFDEFSENPPNVSLCEVGGKEKETDALKLAEVEAHKKTHPDVEMRTLEIGGVPVKVAAEEAGEDADWFTAWAVVGDVMVEANTRKLMEYMIGALKSGVGDANGVAREHLTRIKQQTQGDRDLLIYINGAKLYEMGEKTLVEAEAKKKPEEKFAGGLISPQQILGAIGLNEMQALAVSMNLNGDQFVSDMVLLHPEKPTGLVSIMRTSGNEVALPTFIPEDVLEGGVARYDMAGFYDKVLGMINKLGPMAMMVTMQLPQFEAQLGFKVRDDFLGSLQDEVVSVQNGEVLKQSQVAGFKIKDAAKLGGALESLKTFVGAGFGAFEESDYLGFQVNTLKLSQTATAASELAYCNTGKYLLVSMGDQSTLRKVLARMKDPTGPSLWDNPQVQKLLTQVTPGYGSVNVTNIGSLVNMLATAASALESTAGTNKKGPAKAKKKGPGKKSAEETEESAAESKPAAPMLDSSAMPTKEVFERYFGRMLGTQYAQPDAVHVQQILISPEAK